MAVGCTASTTGVVSATGAASMLLSFASCALTADSSASRSVDPMIFSIKDTRPEWPGGAYVISTLAVELEYIVNHYALK